MKIALTALLLIIIPSVGWTETITVGGTTMEIPAPPGFVMITPEMMPLRDVQRQTVPATNEQFIAFIAEADKPAALKGEIPDLTRTFSVQVPTDLITRLSTNAEFRELKDLFKNQSAAIENQLKRDTPQLTDKMNKGLSDALDTDVGLAVNEVKMLPPHHETERSLAFSAITKFSVNDEAGKRVPLVTAATSTAIHIKGRTIIVYAYAEESGLEWGREISKQWADAIIKANPSDASTALQEAAKAGGFNWTKILIPAIVGGIVGGWTVFSKRKELFQKPSPPHSPSDSAADEPI
ncbi:MAG: hypothetical protein JWN70_659 [Planctomycetaceae bacterium]|nr:hypothetical protein [Planctomycetaceae bacterium]